ncbi:2-succinyl-6-hydroxy-2,4-cyclohexadiene-1-carboxylate synthase [Staphylococcus schleiferi subsp. coagulans]|uniref:2-succinyl-6-hydroxy-2, 4-cyclohexadiene-1-carboxylate synthase n=1 Tax=Staphylococcus coagulans TaxID=74706 RepID=UPI0015F9BF84|nr:2-succinyl-6-hydroxy-2,4-cyclohexadiene-1-carboxylate synthase [Staphylococcus coagulans]MBA8779642.1 2-succinyl-6-hydroxy-2,4-cyclohexadiene-1-carboxylate synthase [Staphylococcus coagulans]
MLHYNWHRAQQPTDKVLVLLHGFISDQRTFDSHIERLTREADLVCVDLPGHGQDQSPTDIQWDFDWIASELHIVLQQFDSQAIYLHGYSMGARVALYYALNHASLLSGLILESGSPGIQDPVARHERQQVDVARARVLEIAGVEVFVNDWEKLPLFQTQKWMPEVKQLQVRQLRMAQNATGLIKALTDYGTGHMPNLWNQLNTLELPVQLIVGEWDEKFVSIAHQMKVALPHASLEIVERVGHTVHVEDSPKFDTILLEFIKGY